MGLATTIPRRIAKLEYAAIRLPFALLDKHVVARKWDDEALLRRGFERLLGSMDRAAGRFFADHGTRAAHERDVPAGPAAEARTAEARTAEARTAEVMFSLPAEIEASSVALCGDFNDWSADSIKLERASDGSWRATVALTPGRRYRYRYLIDGQRWENAWEADSYVPNSYGSYDSVVLVE